MPKKFYFISDAHLGIESREKNHNRESLLISFLNEISSDAEEIFIVGDLFDFWIEYRSVVPKGYYRLFSCFEELLGKGVKITYLAGNHDFWRGNYFEEEFGLKIIDKPVIKEINGKRLLITHGDGLAYKDTGYKILKVILRSRLCQFLYSMIHPDVGIWLAKKTSATSRDYTDTKDFSKKNGLKDFAERTFKEGYNYIVMGHRHNPEYFKFSDGTYINLGDWIRNYSYAVFDGYEMKMFRYYDVKQNIILPVEDREINFKN